MKRVYGITVLFIAILLLAGFVILIKPDMAGAASYTSTVERVVDGDTVYLKSAVSGTTKVRLLSIDTPETNYQGQAQNPWGNAATNFLKQLLPAGTTITLQTDVQEKDAYGRLLAHIYKGNLDVNREIVRQGHAITYYIWPNMLHFEEYQAAYREAKQAGRGMWNPANPLPELPFEFRDRIAGEPQDKYVGHYDTKKFVDPADYQQVPIAKRVFFFKESEALSAGYTKGGGVPATGTVLINEVLPTPATAFSKEFVELYNPGTAAVTIGGWVLDDITSGGSAPYIIPGGTTIPAKGFFVWEVSNYYNSSGDSVTLKDASGKVVDQYSYSSASPDASWYRSPDGGNWATAQDSSPTRGAANQ